MTLCVRSTALYKAHDLPLQLDSDLLDTIGIFLCLTHDVIYWIASLL